MAFPIHLTTFLEGILPLYVCSIFTGFLLTKNSLCTNTSFFKSCKNRGRSFCRPQAFPGRFRALRGDYFAPVALLPDPCPKVLIFFLFLHKNICCGYSLEVPRQGASNEYHNICFHGEIRKIFTGYPPLSRSMQNVTCQCSMEKAVR